jgi:serine/threonine protein kinase
MSDGLHSPTPEHVPKRIGKYRIVRQIAQGGMAEIFLASATGIEGFEKLCVLKRILPLLAVNQEFVQMFLDEARIAASLLHSNIAQVFDIGSEKGSYYFVMEFLRGEDVRHILQESVKRKNFVPYEHIVTMMTGVCSGMHYAHEMRGKDGKPLSIVHRDISPQNVFVTSDGNVKLCDFGIAKSATQLTETRVGTLKGKIRYMSPEQCQSHNLDRRSDIFSLSIVLWELITLRRLYTGKSDFEIFKAIVEEPAPPPSGFRADVPPGLEAIVMKGLDRDRDKRFQTAQELQIALEDWARADRVPASPVRLAAFMTELFGPQPTTVESFLERATEADPLARRIKALNKNESSDSGILANQRVEALSASGSMRSLDADTTTASMPEALRAARRAEGELSDSEVLLTPRRPPRVLVAIAILLCVAALGALFVRLSAKPAATVATSVEPTALPTAPSTAPAKALPPTRDPLAAPTLPVVEAPRPVEPPQPLEPIVAKPTAPRPGPPRPGPVVHPPVAKKIKHVAPQPAKKSGAPLDDLLPP